jgi:hypothetical protein
MNLWWMVACTQTCEVGFEERDGLCYAQRAPVALEDTLAGLPSCTAGVGDGRIDLKSGCIDPLCIGMTMEEVFALQGEPDELVGVIELDEGQELYRLYALWPDGLAVLLDDTNGNNVADPDELILYVYATEPYEGTTTSGLGIGVEMSCALGLAPVQEAYLTVSDGTLSASMLVFENVVVYDHDQDGRVYYLTVW